jgi:hypothetical protein
MALRTIQNVLSSCYLYFSPWFIMFSFLAYHPQAQPPPFDLWYLIFSFFRVCLIFGKAVALILKHATFLRLSNLPESALTFAELDYQKANIDVAIQQHLIAHPEPTVEDFASFVMATDIGLFIFPFVTSISYHLSSV